MNSLDDNEYSFDDFNNIVDLYFQSKHDFQYTSKFIVFLLTIKLFRKHKVNPCNLITITNDSLVTQTDLLYFSNLKIFKAFLLLQKFKLSVKNIRNIKEFNSIIDIESNNIVSLTTYYSNVIGTHDWKKKEINTLLKIVFDSLKDFQVDDIFIILDSKLNKEAKHKIDFKIADFLSVFLTFKLILFYYFTLNKIKELFNVFQKETNSINIADLTSFLKLIIENCSNTNEFNIFYSKLASSLNSKLIVMTVESLYITILNILAEFIIINY